MILGLRQLFSFLKKFLIPVLAISIFVTEARATHLRAGEITVQRISCQELTFRITITVFTDIGPQVTAKFGQGELDFGDGTVELTPRQENPLDLGNDVGYNQYVTEHTYQGNGIYTITYTEPNRNDEILNMSNSVNTKFHLETVIFLDPFLGCNNTPVLLVPPIDRGCTQNAFYHNPGAFDFEGDSLSYEFVIPKSEKGINVLDYVFPNHASFNGMDEDGIGPATLTLNPSTGEIVWNSPGQPGEYNIAFKVTEWRIIDGIAFKLGHVTRDMQIIVEDCDNERPEIVVPEDVCVIAGEIVQGVAIGSDPDGDPVKVEAFGGPFEVTPAAVTIPANPGFVPTPTQLVFEWQTDCNHIRIQPYQVEFKVSDNPPTGPTLVEFGTWNITVVGPPPVLLCANPELMTGRNIRLDWEAYKCDNAETIQIWRRVDSFDFDPGECVTGMPLYAGYELIKIVPATQNFHMDLNLDVGASYCYRLVAVFPAPGGGLSVVSNEVCADPILADAPVITHVTVEVTDEIDGQINVSWTAPFQLDPIQFPPPYRYDVYRAAGLIGETELVLVGSTSDTTITDSGINTVELPYNYRIYLFDVNDSPVDTSAVASSVRLTPQPLIKEIQLNWIASVPWSNQVQDFPYHYIYRDNVDAGDPAKLQLIDSVNVLLNGFTYSDTGFNGVELKETTEYCYYIETMGSYGNPLIAAPQRNLSQIICTQPSDTIPPCAPLVSIDTIDCENFKLTELCNFNTYSNTISWNEPQECADDIRSYNIYFSRTGQEGSFNLINNITETNFVHDNIPSFAGCYLVTSVDRSGNESDFSEMVCNDNCPNYVLPNVFTPNGDGYNDVFGAFNQTNLPSEDEPGSMLPDLSKCPRFVRAVNFMVYNRWGKEVFKATSAGENSLFINWNGKNSDGSDASAGTYYYVAEVTYDVLNPRESVRILKGWIQLVR